MSFKEVYFFKRSVFALMFLFVMLFSVVAVSASVTDVTLDTPSAATTYITAAAAVTTGATFTGNMAGNATWYISTDAGTTWTHVSNHSNSSANQLLWNLTITAANFSSDANYTLNITVNNGTGDFTATLANIQLLDTTAPTGHIQFKDTLGTNLTTSLKIDYGAEMVVNCTFTDATSIIDISKNYMSVKLPGLSSYTENLTLTKNTTAQVVATVSGDLTRREGELSIKCFAQDNAGNNLEKILNFSTQTLVQGGTSPFVDPNFVAPIAKKVIGKGTMEDYAGKYGSLPEQGEARLIKKLGGIRFLLAEEEHEIKVEEMGDSSVTLLISSEPFTVSLEVNETKEIDVNADGVNDLEIYLHKIHQKSADLVFKEISSPAPLVEEVIEAPSVEDVTDVVETPEGEGEFGWLWTLLILIIVIVVLMVVVHRISGKGSPSGGKGPIKFTPRDLGSSKDASSWGQKSDNSAKPFY
ncbi:hypothetical protein HOF78_03625 [Candidatus Woesearchaeota archaeon]|jgi:hypothetical protein|nr:hypothetical protein [Candidatus Woesearchaeota archaeon]MBT6044756.1 hypothetical protein [Candidatus Woesearchaeota archaeon]